MIDILYPAQDFRGEDQFLSKIGVTKTMLEKKIALITGANRGIGFETARQLGKRGVVVILGARAGTAAALAAQTLVDEGIEAYPLALDVNSEEGRKQAVQFISDKFGVLDILINNAGVGGDGGITNAHTSSTTDFEFQTVFRTNVLSVLAVTRECLPLIRKSPAGRIVNVSSILGSLTLQSKPDGPIAPMKAFAHNASKTALNAFTIHLAGELKDSSMKVNSAHPGWVKTELGTKHAELEVSEGAKTSVELALLGPEGPTGKFIHAGSELPW